MKKKKKEQEKSLRKPYTVCGYTGTSITTKLI